MEGRCMKCSEQKTMKDVNMTQTSRGGYMGKGKCESCGTTICRICSKDDALKSIDSGEAKKAF
tara:strand:- start:2445 stop:2633 length:189 start_codon:yes stop_codon:yes gene_type:complete